MKYKNILIFLSINLLAITALLTFRTPTNKSSAQPCNLLTINDYIRVGISNKENRLEYNEASVSASSNLEIINKNDGAVIASGGNNDIFNINMIDNKFNINKDDKVISKDVIGPLEIRSLDSGLIQVVNITRKGRPALYKGEIEIDKAPTKNNLLSVVNILPVEEYLKGVVPNELPTSFGLEALKAQAVAARNYAIRPRIKFYKQFDICDTVDCQVYFGANTEEKISNQAIEDTKGLLALYNDEVILALYSSTAGGYTENYENAFSDPATDAFPAKPIPYLKGKPDICGIPSLETEENTRQFYSSIPQAFDVNSGFYRWHKTWTREELESILNKNLDKYRFSELITPKFEKDTNIGTLKDIQVMQRGVSGKAMAIKVTTSNGEWLIKKELLIRRIFMNAGKILPSANVIFDKTYDENGNITFINAFGGGLGHGVGMSQYGAGYMAKNGYTFDQILQHYYDGVSIGTAPIMLNSQNTSVTQKFASPNCRADLIIYNNDRLNNIVININSNNIVLPLNKKEGELKFDLSQYIKSGTNEIVYSLPNNEKDKSVKAWIEVFSIQNIK